MPLTPGTRLEPYEILAPLGAGGMGEVYRARDPRLDREVAIKILSASPADRDRVARFEQEARAAGSLNHPNIVVVYDVGVHDGSPYVVSELLEGETLRQRLRRGSLSGRKALDYAVQIAQGLAAAHEKGIHHRDLKPENLFLTNDGRAKILDFGLAKLAPTPPSGAADSAPTFPVTEPGTILGTVGYMAPEQVRGRPADHRSDIFSLGAVLYEMLSRRQAFPGDTPADAMSAILREEPPPLPESGRQLPSALARIVQHCLEKDPEQRFQSARDLVFDLHEVQRQWITSDPALPAEPARRSRWQRAWPVPALALIAVGLWVWKDFRQEPATSFRQLTFRRGTLVSARFAPDARSLIYAAAWDGQPLEVLMMRPDNPESRSLGYPGAKLLALSGSGELAIGLRQRYAGGERFLGTLARVPLGGGAPREVLEDVEEADWSPDGTRLAVVRSSGVGGRSRLEYPIGTLLFESDGAIRDVRVAPDGERVAFYDDSAGLRASGSLTVIDRRGTRRALTRSWASARGLAWSPNGAEIWFTAGDDEAARRLRAVTLSGDERVLVETPGSLTLHDMASASTLLLSRDEERHGILGLVPGALQERELSWFDQSSVGDLSDDGRFLLFGDRTGVYLRRTDGSPAVRLGEGYADTLSPDGHWALAASSRVDQLLLLPTGPGEARTLPSHTIESYAGAYWFPDGKRILFNGSEPGRRLRSYVQDLDGGVPRAITPEGTWAETISPDGTLVATSAPGQAVRLYPVNGGESHSVKGSESGDRPAGWTADRKSLWVFKRGEVPAPVYRLDLTSGLRALWKRLMPADSAGVVSVTQLCITPDGSSYAYTYRRVRSDLYLCERVR